LQQQVNFLNGQSGTIAVNELDGSQFQQLANTPYAGDPNSIVSMDEDYDACDLENWFLSVQSADGKVIIPSFHRPGILRVDPNSGCSDWTSLNATSEAKILRPRAADHPKWILPDPTPDPVSGQINYDVDNDGDGTTDSVWLDLGYAPRR